MSDIWLPVIDQFEAEAAASPPKKGSVVFTGSSTIRLWERLQADFPFIHTVNRGFGGSCYADAARHAARIVSPCNPSLVVTYSGGNDLANGLSPAEIVTHVDALVQNVQSASGKIPMLFIGINSNPSRWDMAQITRQTNSLLAEYVRSNSMLQYVDTFEAMLGADSGPRGELFVEDQLHMNTAGYELWRQILTPVLRAYVSKGLCPPRETCL